MKIKGLIKFVYGLLTITLFSCKNVSDSANLTLSEKLSGAVQNYISEYDIKTALSMTVFNGDFLICKNYGKTSLTSSSENDETTLHYVYSISKTFTAAVILNLIQKNKISQTDTVGKFLPELLGNEFINSDATIAELLNHTSGIFDYVENPKLFTQNPFLTQEWNPLLLVNFIEHVATERGLFNYSSMNFILLGKIAELAASQSMNEMISEMYLKPLNLSSLALSPQDEIDYIKVSHPHVYPNTALSLAGDGKTPIDVVSVISPFIQLVGKSSWAAGGMVGTASDIARWGYNLYSKNGTGISDFVRSQMLDSVAEFTSEDSEAYGFGTRKIFYDGYEFIGSYGRSIGSENLMFYNPDTDACFVILTSSNASANRKPNIDDLLFSLFECFYEN